IFSVTFDNATSNNAMIKKLQEKLDGFLGAEDQTRCFAHIINLAAKSLWNVFN
ncbi:hypothetical protein BT96DRAFT_759785, partial [Gymnopus androsaceus JB14]